MDYEKFKIAEYTHWAVYLHQNQYYLGRVYIWSKRPGLVDLMDITDDEQRELFSVARIVRLTLSELFKPDMFNWASLGNLSAQCHLHVIPRYSSKRVFSDLTFEDKNWGKNYAPYDYEFHTPEAVLGVIRFAIKQVLDRDKSNDRYLKPPGDSKMREAWDALGKRFSK